MPNLRSASSVSSLVAARGPLRRVLAALAGRFVAVRGWERLGFARTRDYSIERLGLSARCLQDLARVDAQLARLPAVEAALVSGALTWTKVRLVCRVAQPEDEAQWVALALRVTARQLAGEVRAVDVGCVEAADPGTFEADEDGASEERRECIRIRCTPAVRSRWWSTRQLARRVAGEALPVWQAMENVAAEVLSAFPLAPAEAPSSAFSSPTEAGPREARSTDADRGQIHVSAAANGCADHGLAAESPAPPAGPLPPFLASLVEGLDDADAFELDARLRRAVALEQRLESDVGRHLHEVAGNTPCSMDVYAREQLGISPRKARGLLRMSRVAAAIPELHTAWSTGRLSWAKAQMILPRLIERPEEARRWIDRAASVTVRRLEADVEERERQTGAQDMSGDETCEIFWLAPVDVARLFRATLCSVRRRIERATGRLPSEGEAFGAMLDHAFVAWGGDERRVLARFRVFSRDGWRCTVPGCSSYRNLHDHHIRFRSAGGSNDEANRTTLCAWHHLRGVHGGRVRITGRAPEALRFELGLRAGRPPLLSFRGD